MNNNGGRSGLGLELLYSRGEPKNNKTIFFDLTYPVFLQLPHLFTADSVVGQFNRFGTRSRSFQLFRLPLHRYLTLRYYFAAHRSIILGSCKQSTDTPRIAYA